MSNKFTEFDNTTSPSLNDYQVGYSTISGITKEKRWLASAWKTFWQGVLNIKLLDRESNNYVEIEGSGSTAEVVRFKALGSDANINVNIVPKGTGVVQTSGILTTSGNELRTDGGLFTTLGGVVNTGGGNIETSGGNVNVGVGGVNLAGGNVSLSGASVISITGTGGITVASGNVNLTSGNVNVSAGNVNVTNGDVSVGGSLAVDLISSNALSSVSMPDGLTANSDIVVLSADVIVSGGEVNTPALLTAEIAGTIAAPPAGDGNLAFTNAVQFNNSLFAKSGIMATFSVRASEYLRAGYDIGKTATAGGGQQAFSTITKQFNQFSTVATIADSATLPILIASSVFDTFVSVVIRNDGANSMDIFPRTGGTINGGAVDAGIALAAGSQVTLYGVDVAGVDTWFTA